MTTENPPYLAGLEEAINEVAKHALEVDAKGEFPRASIEAIRARGLFGLTMPKELGGSGQGLRAAAEVVERLGQVCASTAMIMTMHYVAAAKLGVGPEDVKRGIASGKMLATVALSEAGSRSHFWAPIGTAKEANGGVQLDAKKSWVTSSQQADVFVWSSKSLADPAKVTLWAVPRDTNGIRVSAGFDGLGMRGNTSTPMIAEGAIIAKDRILGEDGKGFDILMGVGLPTFNVLNAAVSVGITRSAFERTVAHVKSTRLEHMGLSLAQLPTVRAYLARMRLKTESARLLLADTVVALESNRADALLRVIESKALCGETATEVTELAMRVCGGAAFRKEVGVERNFRDARAATVMAPTTDALYDFLGRALCDMPLFD